MYTWIECYRVLHCLN